MWCGGDVICHQVEGSLLCLDMLGIYIYVNVWLCVCVLGLLHGMDEAHCGCVSVRTSTTVVTTTTQKAQMQSPQVQRLHGAPLKQLMIYTCKHTFKPISW